jgi:prophage regulatory protein
MTDTATDNSTIDRMLSVKEVEDACGMSRWTIYRRIREKRFPRAAMQTGAMTRWRASEIRTWQSDPEGWAQA